MFSRCGIINHGRTALQCNEAVETDCTAMKHLTRYCPSSCPYVAPHPELSCVFECASALGCSASNAEFAYPNNDTYVCESCKVVGCRLCASPDICLQCFDNFWLELGGRVCAYVWDEEARHGVHAAAALCTVLVLIASLVLVILDHCNCLGRCVPEGPPAEEEEEILNVRSEKTVQSLSPAEGEGPDRPLVGAEDLPRKMSGMDMHEQDPTLRALTVGNLHRLRCKIKDLEVPCPGLPSEGPRASRYTEDGEQQPPQGRLSSASALPRFGRIPMWVDLRSRFLAGVGLPLFHQWFYFLFIYSALMCTGTAWIYYGSDLSRVLQAYGLDHASHMLLGQDKMSFCSLRNRKDDLGAAVQAFARRSAIGFLVLWVLGLCLSLLHAARQKWVAAEFYRRHPCLAEFALNIEGFPPEATDEAKIRSFLQDSFGTEALEVSVCYDYRSRSDRVHALLEKVLVLEDVRAGSYGSELAAEGGGGGLGLTAAEKAEVRGWLEPGAAGGLRNAGSVFAVLPHNYDLQRVRRMFDEADGLPVPVYPKGSPPRPVQKTGSTRPPILPHSATPEWLPPVEGSLLKWVGGDGRISDLLIRDVVCEPPDVVWDFLGMETRQRACRFAVASFVIAISFVAMAAAIFVPLAQYSVSFVFQAGSFPTGVMMAVVGTLQMTANWVMCLLHIFVSSRVGFTRRDREGLMVFKAFALLCVVGFLFNVTITIFPVSSAHGGDPLRFFLAPLDSSRPIDSIKEVSFQVRASVHFFHVLVPGTLFIGYLVWPLQGFVWPLVSTFTFLRCWHRRSIAPPLSVRKAELALEPLGLSIGHDYMGTVVQPTCCSLVLFFASGVAWQIFGFMALWSLFMIPFMRYLHFRAVRRCYHTTNRLDSEVLFWWGCPLSLVLAASCFWAARLRGWPMYAVPLAWACGNAVYAALLALWIRPLSPPKDEGHACHRPTYDEVRCRRFYDWDNCNPIKVLLSHCREDLSPIPPFEIGKEYLQVNDPSWHTRMAKAMHSSELYPAGDSHEGTDCIPNLHIPEVETFVQRPMETILGIVGGRGGRPLDSRTPPRRARGRAKRSVSSGCEERSLERMPTPSAQAAADADQPGSIGLASGDPLIPAADTPAALHRAPDEDLADPWTSPWRPVDLSDSPWSGAGRYL